MEEFEFKVETINVLKIKVGDGWVSWIKLFELMEDLEGCCMVCPMIIYDSNIEQFLLDAGVISKMSRGGVYARDYSKVEELMKKIEEAAQLSMDNS